MSAFRSISDTAKAVAIARLRVSNQTLQKQEKSKLTRRLPSSIHFNSSRSADSGCGSGGSEMAVTDYDIPTLERTINGRRSMRSVADALEALRNAERLPLGSLLEVRTSPLPARNADRPSIVIVVCRGGLSEQTWGVALPTSYEFSGRPLGKNAAETCRLRGPRSTKGSEEAAKV
jgi:hypothetical protein